MSGRRPLGLVALVIVLWSPAFADATGMPSEWPTIQGDYARTGFHGDIHGPGTGEVVWRFLTDSISVTGIPAVANGRVYVGGGNHHVYALDALTGELVWKYDTGASVEASPVVAQGKVYVASRDDHLYALDEETGNLEWRFHAPDNGLIMPTVHNETIYFGANGGLLYALDADDGSEKWTFDVKTREHRATGYSVTNAPLVLNDTIYFGAGDAHVYAVQASNGAFVWEHRLETAILGSLATDGSRIFAAEGRGMLYAFDPTNGTLLWRHDDNEITGGPGGPSVRNGVVYRDGYAGMFAVDAATGVQLWHAEYKQIGKRQMAVSENAAYSLDGTGIMRALHITNGSIAWENEFTRFSRSSPVMVDGLIYTGSEQFWVYALDAGAGLEPLPSTQPLQSDRGFDLPGPPAPVLITMLALAALAGRHRRRGQEG